MLNQKHKKVIQGNANNGSQGNARNYSSRSGGGGNRGGNRGPLSW